jgi:hypothetical protein
MDKDHFQQGQHQNTHSQGLVSHLEAKVNAAAAKYWVARQALNTLAPLLGQVRWEANFQVLNASDIQGLTDSLTSEYYKELHKLKVC